MGIMSYMQYWKVKNGVEFSHLLGFSSWWGGEVSQSPLKVSVMGSGWMNSLGKIQRLWAIFFIKKQELWPEGITKCMPYGYREPSNVLERGYFSFLGLQIWLAYKIHFFPFRVLDARHLKWRISSRTMLLCCLLSLLSHDFAFLVVSLYHFFF